MASVLLINGSPRENGCTATALREMISVFDSEGIGTELMRRMLELLKAQGYKRASLAVQKANYAVRMYAAVGFRTVDENAEEYIMVRDLQIPG